jgi:hypothetical protein
MPVLHSLLLTPEQSLRLKMLLTDESHGGEYPVKDCALCQIAQKLENILIGHRAAVKARDAKGEASDA